MEYELVKKTIRVGNSAGVLLPKEWLDSEVKIILQPLDIEKEIIDILRNEGILSNILGVGLVGSYSRNEQTLDSDIDVLVITDKLNKQIKKGKYDFLLISEEKIKKQLENNALPIFPMLMEAKPIFNSNLIKNYLENFRFCWRNLRSYIKSTKLMMNKVLEDIEFAKKLNYKVSDASAYSLVLRIRTLYIINSLIENKLPKNKRLINLIKRVSGSELAYQRYIKSKKLNSQESNLPVDEAEKLISYIIKENERIEKWLKEKKD